MVKFHTSLGPITLELDAGKAPLTVANFLQYVESGFYGNTLLHRVIDGFMIQGGGFSTDMAEKPTRGPIALESGRGLSNLAGTVAMARTNAPNSATSQFFINVADNLRLDGSGEGTGYAVFGKVVEGQDVVDRIRVVPTGNKAGFQNVPQQTITIQKATLEK